MDATVAKGLEVALDTLRKTEPRGLEETLKFLRVKGAGIGEGLLPGLVSHLAACGPNDGALHSFTLAIQGWDHQDKPDWAEGAEPHSQERRDLLLGLLGFNKQQQEIVNKRVLRLSGSAIPIVIAEEHQVWYEERRPLIRDFYWSHYVQQLRGSGWNSDGIARLDASTDDVISRLSDPNQTQLYPAKGLVMGYVQSGKTSHFSGLIAKAGDAGYRLIIVLAGTLDILRRQTQRRIDKEIVGKELLDPDEYQNDSEWTAFVSHGGRPSDQGTFDWERLTTLFDDYTSLSRHLSVLEFKRADGNLPFNHPDNLRKAAAKIAILKKVPARIDKLCQDLRKLRELRSALEHVPTLIIDDESDQASVNTIDQTKPGNEGKKTSTNKSISALLGLLPRAQYVGYTATPFANVFIDPDDAENLFPKDFIVSLPRPDAYMGVSDFYDFEESFLDRDFRGNKNAFVRPVVGENSDPENLPKAIDSFVLAGAIKLYRAEAEPKRYRFRHHTMLIHYSATTVVHDAQKADVEQIFGGGARYQTKDGIAALRKLYEADFVPVSKARASADPLPATFEQLRPFIAKCLSNLCSEGQPIRVVNGDERHKDETPDFDQAPVWAILIGGAKLSRGYTVEGLTVSYYRRPTGAGDTLMQMGRWFGFRFGYRDLVRLFIGSREKKGKVAVDLYEAFGAVCRDEEALRAELLKYSRGGLTPKQVPPLVRQHLAQLPPTSKNKMFNAEIRSRDFAGEWTEKGSTPSNRTDINRNLGYAKALFEAVPLARLVISYGGTGKAEFQALAGVCDASKIVTFLKSYLWSDGKRSMTLELAYIENELKEERLGKWLILLPQLKKADVYELPGATKVACTIIERARVSETRFGVFSEPRHRAAASYAAGLDEIQGPSPDLESLRDASRPVLVIYLVKQKDEPSSEITVGFGIQYPGVKKDKAITWTVRDSSQTKAIVVPAGSKTQTV